SWWAQRYAGATAGAASTGLGRCVQSESSRALSGWSYVDAKVPVRVWYQPRYDATDKRLATDLAGVYDRVYPALTGLLGGPESDDGSSRATHPCAGGSNAYDVALMDMGKEGTTWGENDCDGGAAFTDLNRTPANDIAANATHELMHAIQYAY